MDNKKKLIVNSAKGNLLNELIRSIKECKKFYFSVAFINFSGFQLLLDTFKEAEDQGKMGKILTSTYLNFTDVKALEKIREFNNIDLKVFVTDREIGFHTKVYIFENEDHYKVIIGSSNITQSALKSNIEWNVQLIEKDNSIFINDVFREFDTLWKQSDTADEEFINDYKEFIENIKQNIPTYKNVVNGNLKVSQHSN